MTRSSAFSRRAGCMAATSYVLLRRGKCNCTASLEPIARLRSCRRCLTLGLRRRLRDCCPPSAKIAASATLGIRFAVLVQPRGAALFYLLVPEHLSIHARSIRAGDLLRTARRAKGVQDEECDVRRIMLGDDPRIGGRRSRPAAADIERSSTRKCNQRPGCPRFSIKMPVPPSPADFGHPQMIP